jgi:cyclic pyranopterin phosphate synthase
MAADDGHVGGPSAADGTYSFEGIDATLPFVPVAARRTLDAAGRKLSLEGWLSLDLESRRALVQAGRADRVARDTFATIERARPEATPMTPVAEPDATAPPPEVVATLGADRPLSPSRWAALSPLDRYALAKYASKPEKLARAYDEIAGGVRFSHLTATGAVHMVDVGRKEATARRATAAARVWTTPEVIAAIGSGSLAKGEVLAAARVAGILAAKRTPELIPLCHPVQTTRVTIDFALDAAHAAIDLVAVAEAVDRTGVEMEAMVAASVAALTVYDMIKSADRWATIEGLRLERKSGGKSGDVTRPAARGGDPE